MRDLRAKDKLYDDHWTIRKCKDPNCQAYLKDTLVDFGQGLPKQELDLAFAHSEMADLHLCLGSSLRVTPASQMPLKTT